MFHRVKTYLNTPVTRLHRWEVVFLAMLAAAVFCCGWLTQRQALLAGRMVRLHVIANSDSEEDQALKLRVRDAVLERAAALVEGASNADQAAGILEDHLEELAAAGQAVVAAEGGDDLVTAALDVSYFPTKTYDGFALPAGNYRALRVSIGAGEGRNWWCVVFPSLCVVPASEWEDTAVSGGLTEEDVRLMGGEDGGYVLRFKCLELWERLLHSIQGN